MLKYLLVFLSLFTFQSVFAQYPDGTIVLSYKKGLVGRIAKRITGGDQYTHIGIVIDGRVYESDWPRTKSQPVHQYGKRRTTNDYYVPVTPYSQHEVNRMRSYANSNMGQPYQLRNYFHPNTRQTRGTWCSPFVGKTLNSSGRYGLSTHQMHEPQNIINTLRNGHRFTNRVRR